MISVSQDALPDYRELYYRWEHEQWAAGAIELSMDRSEWDEGFSQSLRRAFLWGSSVAFVAREDQVRDALVSFVDAAPTEEQQVFLTTQLVDTARHTVFFDRFSAGVLGETDGDMESRGDARSLRPNDALLSLLTEVLPAASDGILSDPSDPEPLIEGIVLYHLVIEVALASTTQGFLLAQLPNEGALPGLREGLGAVARDQERHADFAVRFLGDMIVQNPHHRDVIQGALGRHLPVGLAALEPSGTANAADQQAYRPEDLRARARRALSERLSVIGVELPS